MQCRKFYMVIMLMVLLVLGLQLVTASLVEATPVKNQISPSEEAVFELLVKNTGKETQRYSIYSLQSGQGWMVEPSPLKYRILELSPGQQHQVKVLVRPLEIFAPGIYTIRLNIDSDLGERYEEDLKVYLGSEKPLDYIPSIKITLDMPEKINPIEPVYIKLFLENRNPLDLTDLAVKIQSDLPEFSKSLNVDLPPMGKKTVEFTVAPNPFQQPKEYSLFFVFERGGQTVKVLEKRIEILTRVPEFSINVNEDKMFMKKHLSLKVTNDGNLLNTQEVKYPLSLLQSLFVQGSVNTKKIEGERYAVWDMTLKPNESEIVPLVINYRLILYLLIISLALGVFYWQVQAPLVLKKSAITSKGSEEGTLSEIKVTLEVVNKSKALKKVTVTDLVPAIANVEKSLELGTLRPKEIKHTPKGTKVIWSLAEIDPNEQRIITYKIRAKLNILGTFSLPRATVECFTKKGRKGKAYSNIFRVNA